MRVLLLISVICVEHHLPFQKKLELIRPHPAASASISREWPNQDDLIMRLKMNAIKIKIATDERVWYTNAFPCATDRSIDWNWTGDIDLDFPD